MTIAEFESTLIEFLHRKPFAPFLVELCDGKRIPIVAPSIAIRDGSAVYFTRTQYERFDYSGVKQITSCNPQVAITA